MIGITEDLGKIINILEDAIEESDWSLVQKCYDDLDDLYDKLERGDDAFQGLSLIHISEPTRPY